MFMSSLVRNDTRTRPDDPGVEARACITDITARVIPRPGARPVSDELLEAILRLSALDELRQLR